MLDMVLSEIKRLSQEEGLNDTEIANELGCSRATVNRARLKHNIGRANLENRRDKKLTCSLCKKEFFIKRNANKEDVCAECRKLH